MVLAGPGSGKTHVITNRIYHLITNEGVSPSCVLVITFTKAAAVEMQERFYRLCGDKKYPVNFGTFHGIFFKILKYAYNYNASSILREEERMAFFREALLRHPMELEDETDFLEKLTGEISQVKNSRIEIDHYYSTNCPQDVFRAIYREYQEFLIRRRLLDFDDMLVYCYELFSQRKDILALWQRKYQYILIDEFQDVNPLQYQIVRMLALPENNLFVVGDDDQSIYGFRGSNPSIMLHFGDDYKDAKRILLDVNYRCSRNILTGSMKVIRKNQKRYDKQLTSAREKGEPIRVRRFPGIRQEVDVMVEEILAYHGKGIPYSDMAVLGRTNGQFGLLVYKLMEHNVPFRMKDVMPNVYEHWIVKNIRAYVRLARGEGELRDFLQIMNRPNRYLSRDAIQGETVDFDALMEYYSDREWMQERVDKLQFDLSRIQMMTPYAAIQYLRKSVGYDEYLKEYAEYRRLNLEELQDVLNEVQENAREFDTYEKWFAYMEEYGRKLKEKAALRREESVEGVTLSTMHGAKGLEYRVVFLPDANEGITPHAKAQLDADVEEERRLFYVAMTRGKDYLHVYYVKERYNKEMEPSRFVRELIEKSPRE